MRNIGLDVGDKRIGVAMSDPEGILASPLATISRDSDEIAIDAIVKLVSQHNVHKIIVGFPYSLDGNVGSQADKVMDFVERLSRCTEADIEVQDERLSTKATENLLIEAGIKNRQRKERLDAATAAYILQGYLDSQNLINNGTHE
jgi:putative Holliday junction resolvase